MFAETAIGRSPQLEGARGPSRAAEVLKTLAPAAFGALILGGIAAVGVRYDNWINHDLVQTLVDNWSWDRLFSTKHALTALAQMHPGMVEGAYALIGGFASLITGKAFPFGSSRH